MVTAAALGDALGVPVHGVCSLDAIAADAGGVDGAARRRHRRPPPRGLLGRLRRGGARIAGPHVEAPAALADRLPELGAVAAARRLRRR